MSQADRVRKYWAAPIFALAAFVAAGAAFSQPPSAADVASARHQHFKDQGKAFKTLQDQLHSGSPDAAVVKAAAHALAASSQALPSWFPAGSGPQPGVTTHARPEVWSDPAGFAAAARAFQAEAAKLQAVADSGDMAATAAQAQATGATCGACHKKYREVL